MTATATTPTADLVQRVRAGLILRGTSLTAWARKHNTDSANVRHALAGSWAGPKGKAIRAKILKDAGINDQATR